MRRISLTALLSMTVAAALADEPVLTHQDVFVSGREGYHTFRIPAIATAADGTLVAVAEARKYNSADPGFANNDIDLVCKRSQDEGRTWSSLQVIDDPGERWAACNPVIMLDRQTGRLWLFHCRMRPGRSSLTARPGTDDAQNWAQYSEDNGASWSKPINLTRVARQVEHWGGSFFGPGGAIQTRSGRLLVPLSRTTSRRDAGGRLVSGSWNAFVIFSDDHGQSWKRGRLLPKRDWGNESQMVELADGRVLIDVRQDSGPHRWMATSDDGGQSWSAPRPGLKVTPVACAIERYSTAAHGGRNRILWTGPKGPGRKRLVVRVSYDEGQTFGLERLISDEPAAYSDLTVLKDRTVGVLWERAGYRFITFSRFNLAFLEGAGTH